MDIGLHMVNDVKRMNNINKRGLSQDISQQAQEQQLSKKEKLLFMKQLANSKTYLGSPFKAPKPKYS